MVDLSQELWDLTFGRPHVDAAELAGAIEQAAKSDALDTRTQWLVRDSVRALARHWGEQRLQRWVTNSAASAWIERICKETADDSDEAFGLLSRRIVDAIKPQKVLEFLRELSTHVGTPTRIEIGGAVALILAGRLSRATEDIDVVDEVPAAIRSQHQLLDSFAKRFGFKLTHFQSHYLPNGWQNRLHSVGVFGKLQVFAVDEYDVFAGKLFSSRDKDRDDLRELVDKLDRALLTQHVAQNTADLRSEPKSAAAAEKNWFVLFGESLPVS